MYTNTGVQHVVLVAWTVSESFETLFRLLILNKTVFSSSLKSELSAVSPPVSLRHNC